ncbi:hypothetical protein ACKVEX_15210 [Rhodocyclaceae bacterium SMB388]
MIDALLSRLERVKQTGPGRWIASAPTRDDKRPSLTIRQLDDGRILLHDFGGDSVDAVLAAVGLDWSALFPERAEHQAQPMRRPWLPADVFDVARLEVGVVAVIASDMVKQRSIADADFDRLQVAISRLAHVAEVAYGHA